MKRLIFSALAVLALTGAGFYFAPYIPSSPTAKVEVSHGVANIIVAWTDTAATMVRSEIRRRGIRADTLLGGLVSDTVWQARGYVGGGLTTFRDRSALWGRTYRYEVRDSIGGVAFSGWSDSASVTIPTRKY